MVMNRSTIAMANNSIIMDKCRQNNNQIKSSIMNTDLELICAIKHIYETKLNLLYWLLIDFNDIILTFYDRIIIDCKNWTICHSDDQIIRNEACRLLNYIQINSNCNQQLLIKMIQIEIQKRFPTRWHNKLLQVLNTGGISALQYVLRQLCRIDVHLTSLLSGEIVSIIRENQKSSSSSSLNGQMERRQNYIILNVLTFYLATVEQYLLLAK